MRGLSENTPVSELLQLVLGKTNYTYELSLEKSDEANDRILNVQELINKATEFEKQSENPFLAAFLEDVALVADIDNFTENDETVVLMTLHSSKGLEFPCVFIPGFEEGIFPGYRSTLSGDTKELEEERRLCYVGITRAKEQLFITTADQRRQHGQLICNAPSRFIKEIPLELIEDEFVKNMNTLERKKVIFEDKSATIGYSGKISSGISNEINNELNTKAKKLHVLPNPKCESPDYKVGDTIKQLKYGAGIVTEIRPAGADYEISVNFPGIGVKKFMAHLSKLEKM